MCYFAGEILKVNDDLSRALEYYRKIFGLVQPTSMDPASPPPAAQTAPSAETAAAGASTLIDLGAANQAGQTVDAIPVSSVLENELKALGRPDI